MAGFNSDPGVESLKSGVQIFYLGPEIQIFKEFKNLNSIEFGFNLIFVFGLDLWMA